MPIKVKLEGSPAPSELQSAYLIVATGLSVRRVKPRPGNTPAGAATTGGGGGAAPTDEGAAEAGPPGKTATLDKGAAAAGPPGKTATLDDADVPAFGEPSLPAGTDGVVRADVHLVWQTGGIMLPATPDPAELHHDPANDLTRLTFAGVELTFGRDELAGSLGWKSPPIVMRGTPGEGDQLLTAYLCRPQELPLAALAAHACILPGSGRSPGIWVRAFLKLFG